MRHPRTTTLAPLTLAIALALALAGCGTGTSADAEADDPTASSSASASTSPSDPTPSASSEDPSSPTPTTSPTTSPTAVTPRELTTDGLATGAAPAVDYVAESMGGEQPTRLIRAGGSEADLAASYDAFAPLGEGLVGITLRDDQPTAVVLDADLHEVSNAPVRGGSLAVTPDGRIVGWLGDDGAPHVVETGGQQYDLPPVARSADIAALLVDGTTCKEGEGGNGCAVFLNSRDATRAWIAVSHGIVDSAGRMLAVGDASDRELLGLVSLTDEGSCWGLFTNPRKTRWETCDHTLTDFSPSGRLVLGTDAYLDGLGQRSLTFLDHDGSELASWRGTTEDAATIVQTVWEDDTHVLAVVLDAGEWSVVRFGVDGTAEYAVTPVPGEPEHRAFTLPTR